MKATAVLLALSLMLGCGPRESERIVGGKAFAEWKALATNERNSLAVRKEAIDALFCFDTGYEVLMNLMRDPRAEIRAAAAWQRWSNHEPAARAVIPVLMELLEDMDVDVRRIAARGPFWLSDMEREAEVIAALTRHLRDDDAEVRKAAAFNLVRMSFCARTSVPEPAELLRDKDAKVCEGAAGAFICRPFNANKTSVSALAALLRDGDADVRAEAAAAFEYMGPPATVVIPALIEALEDTDARVRETAASALGNIGTGAKVAVPALNRSLHDEDEDEEVRGAAEDALAKVKGLRKNLWLQDQ